MAKISDLPELTAPDGTETVPVVKGNQTFRARLDRFLAPVIAYAQAWAESAGEPGGAGTKSAKSWAADAKVSAVTAAQSGIVSHIAGTELSISDGNGNTAFDVTAEGVTRAARLFARSLTVEDPSAVGLPTEHITDDIESIVDSNGYALRRLSSSGVESAVSFATVGGKPIGGSSAARYFVPNTAGQIDAILGYGQSLYSGDPSGVTTPPINQTQPYANLTPTYATGYEHTNVNAPVTAVVPLLAPSSYCEWGGIQGANKITEMMLRDSGLTVAEVPQIYATNSAYRGSGIPTAETAGNIIALKNDVIGGVSYAKSQDKTFNVKAVWMWQGQANPTMTEAAYYAAMLYNYNVINSFVKTTTGQTNDIDFFVWQMEEATGPSLAHVLASHRHPRIHCAFPQYVGQAKVGNTGHYDSVGTALASAYCGVATKRICYDGDRSWRPLEHESLRRRGTRQVVVAYNRKGLVFESDEPNPRWPAQVGHGFYGSDASGGLTVTSAVISDLGIVTVTFNRDIVGDLTFGYGVVMTNRSDTGVYRGGDLRDCDGLTETTTIGGIVYPLHNRALRFEEVI